MNKKSKYLKKNWQLYAMMVLPIMYFIVFKYTPLVGNILAFRKYTPGGSPFGTEWRGFFYFKMFLTDPNFIRAFKNTLIISIVNIVVNFPIPIIFAILLNELKNVHFKKFVQTVSYMPRFISTVVVVSILTDLLSPSSGIVNIFLNKYFDIEPIFFMNEPEYFRYIYIFTETWQFTGWTAIIYLAAITGISEELYEAARIDGANKFEEIRYITIPCLTPTIMVMLILNIGRLLSIGFEKVLLLYTPQNSVVSDIIDTFVYRIGMQEQNYSYATAVGLFGGIIGLILVSSANRFSSKFVGESIY